MLSIDGIDKLGGVVGGGGGEGRVTIGGAMPIVSLWCTSSFFQVSSLEDGYDNWVVVVVVVVVVNLCLGSLWCTGSLL